MSILDRILAFLAPYECLGCTAEGDMLCAACTQQLPAGPEHAATEYLDRTYAGTAYDGIAKQLVAGLKFSGAQSAIRPMASRLLPLLPAAEGMIVMPVPTAVRRVRSRGYDQAGLLARELSRRGGFAYANCLVRTGHTHQVGASREQRLRQLAGAFRVKDSRLVRGRRILLVDDVMTTGATMTRAAAVLREAGAAQVSAVVFASVP